MQSSLEAGLESQIRAADFPAPEREYRFHPERQWRFDFAWPSRKLAVECEGATWTRGRHVTGSGFQKDCEKYNSAALRGWKVLRFTRNMIENGEALRAIAKALGYE